jgi:molybdopterin-binding protein
MNAVPGIVRSVTSDELFAQIEVLHNNKSFSACTLLSEQELPYCNHGAEVMMLFKETDTIISLSSSYAISCRNRFKAVISSISRSNVMARVNADFEGINLTSLITVTSLDALELVTGSAVWYVVKSTSLMLTMR